MVDQILFSGVNVLFIRMLHKMTIIIDHHFFATIEPGLFSSAQGEKTREKLEYRFRDSSDDIITREPAHNVTQSENTALVNRPSFLIRKSSFNSAASIKGT
ncbi:unnamed protein product [Mortierella alpina]